SAGDGCRASVAGGALLGSKKGRGVPALLFRYQLQLQCGRSVIRAASVWGQRSTIGSLPLTDKRHVAGLGAFLALHDVEADPLAFFERAEAVGVDGRKVDENVARAGVRLDETVALFGVEPLDRAFLQKV